MALAIKHLPDDAPDFYSALVSDAVAMPVVQEAVNDAVLFVPVKTSAAELRAQGLLRERELPQMWHCRGGESDMEKIVKHMSVIPPEFKHSVSMEYERLFALGGPACRKQANQFLVRQSKRFRGVAV
ncbi:hypothetical protein B4P00_20245 [Shewanella xiamenensis]|uniref:hypothetical protein n=1 Tax=Shewanella xiamenensis TaxID=332186 RepID=UPI001C4E0B62|nr:hypothetical protein [Shewanella xiamenensis]MBW0298521.1 hypothetical protein [Shewanella xiamenensis]